MGGAVQLQEPGSSLRSRAGGHFHRQEECPCQGMLAVVSIMNFLMSHRGSEAASASHGGRMWCRRVSLRRNSTKWKTCPFSVLKTEISIWPQPKCASASLTHCLSPMCPNPEVSTLLRLLCALMYHQQIHTITIAAYLQIAFMYQKPPGMDAVEKAAAAKVRTHAVAIHLGFDFLKWSALHSGTQNVKWPS